jgi:hypothetical protein
VCGDFRGRAHVAASMSAGSFVQFGVTRSVTVSHALERVCGTGLRVASRFPGRSVAVLRHGVIAAMHVLPFDL